MYAFRVVTGMRISERAVMNLPKDMDVDQSWYGVALPMTVDQNFRCLFDESQPLWRFQ